MKFDKETIVVLVIAGLIMAGWFFLYPQYQKEQAEKLQQQKVEQLKNQNAIRQQKAEEAANVVPAVEKKPVVKETAAAGTEAAVKTIEEKAMVIGYTRMLRRAIRRPNDADSPAKIARCKEMLAILLNKIDTLTF